MNIIKEIKRWLWPVDQPTNFNNGGNHKPSTTHNNMENTAKVIFVSTNSNSSFNADGQHDCAGTWTPFYGGGMKNEYNQIKAAEGIEYLIHRRDGEIVHAYKVVGFHSERRDAIHRHGIVDDSPKTSVGIRFHLKTLSEADEANLVFLGSAWLADNNLQGCRTAQLPLL